ncbi:MAG: hypothetical protein IPM54_31670 [Polyangiaceae bacterium]|nr:hypothetical protein [Polyangiaceae bacterium]
MSATFGKIPQVIMHDVCHDGRSNVNAENRFVSLPNGIPPYRNVFIEPPNLRVHQKLAFRRADVEARETARITLPSKE